ncbi:MAG: DUF3052 domain-containing protein [Gemmatimonadaceae bacterium]
MTKPDTRSFGYSGTPLVKKLGIKPDSRIQFIAAPRQFPALLGELPEGARVQRTGTLDFAIVFVKKFSELTRQFAALRDRLETNGMLWVAWPKRTSGIETDLNENVVREHGLQCGLVDVKICAIDDTWSGLKFVRRLKDRV